MQDLDLLQGAWTVTTLEMDGQQVPSEMLGGARIIVQGNRFSSTGMGATYEGTLELDASVVPRQIDMKFAAGPEKGNMNPGIYEVQGNTLKLCLATRGDARPSSFASAAGSGVAFETLTRESVFDPNKAPQSPEAVPATAGANELDGEWDLVSAVMDGKPMDNSMVKWVIRVSRGNQTTVYAGPQVMLKVEFTIDASTRPKAIDYVGLAGPNKGKAQKGIYEFEDGLLKMCVAAPDSVRPTAFRSVPGDGGTFTVWKRK